VSCLLIALRSSYIYISRKYHLLPLLRKYHQMKVLKLIPTGANGPLQQPPHPYAYYPVKLLVKFFKMHRKCKYDLKRKQKFVASCIKYIRETRLALRIFSTEFRGNPSRERHRGSNIPQQTKN
jgi:hypothetical protein